ncbi:MAG: CCA tRNA nucleotidyltransferase [Gemmatimonadetes bacterium]|nr:CCA tRNA nucleotidyltransferase [Gemmatimonadota bacterium]
MPRTPNPPKAVHWITERLEKAGYETWTVGGAVRDALLGLEAGDWDLTTRARPDEVRSVFRRTVPIGIDHGTVGVLAPDGTLYEVTTFRRDVETFGRHATVEFAERVEEDLARRDFTINAVAWHAVRRELRDPFGGAVDLEAGRIRTVGDPATRFAEDYLRVLRALRFAGYFLFAIEAATWRALCDAVDHLAILSAERVREELVKVLGAAARPSAALGLYAAAGALGELYPELEATVGVDRPDGGPGDVWTGALLAADRIPRKRGFLRLVAVLSGIGLAEALRRGGPVVGTRAGMWAARRAEELMTRLRFSNVEIRRATEVLAHLYAAPAAAAPPGEYRRWLSRVGPELLNDLTRLWIAGVRAEPPSRRTVEPVLRWRAARRVLGERPPLGVEDLAIGGHELMALGLRPGPRFGDILRGLLERVLERPELNEREALLAIVSDEYLGSAG